MRSPGVYISYSTAATYPFPPEINSYPSDEKKVLDIFRGPRKVGLCTWHVKSLVFQGAGSTTIEPYGMSEVASISDGSTIEKQ
jgi:hypothetical protein